MTDTLRVIVKPNSSKDEIVKLDDKELIVRIAAPPEKDKANKELIKFLSKRFKKRVKIIKGLKSRKKTITIS